jgi:hypothetical protein
MLPVDQSVPVRVTHGLGAVTRADLRQHVVDVAFHRRLTDHETLAISVLDRPAAMSVRTSAFFRWDPTRLRHARAAGAGNPARSV